MTEQLKGRKIQVKQGNAVDYRDELLDVGEFGLIIDSEELRIGLGNGRTMLVNGGGSSGFNVTVIDDLTSTSTTSAGSANQLRIVNEKILNHINDEELHEYNFNQYASDKDNNGIFTKVTFKRTNDTVALVSTLSNPDLNGNYQTMTWQYYKNDGITINKTKTWTFVYDSDGDIVSKVIS